MVAAGASKLRLIEVVVEERREFYRSLEFRSSALSPGCPEA
jgi:hypothetical protein